MSLFCPATPTIFIASSDDYCKLTWLPSLIFDFYKSTLRVHVENDGVQCEQSDHDRDGDGEGDLATVEEGLVAIGENVA